MTQSVVPSQCDDCGADIREHGMSFTHEVYGHTKHVCMECTDHYLGSEWRVDSEW